MPNVHSCLALLAVASLGCVDNPQARATLGAPVDGAQHRPDPVLGSSQCPDSLDDLDCRWCPPSLDSRSITGVYRAGPDLVAGGMDIMMVLGESGWRELATDGMVSEVTGNGASLWVMHDRHGDFDTGEPQLTRWTGGVSTELGTFRRSMVAAHWLQSQRANLWLLTDDGVEQRRDGDATPWNRAFIDVWGDGAERPCSPLSHRCQIVVSQDLRGQRATHTGIWHHGERMFATPATRLMHQELV